MTNRLQYHQEIKVGEGCSRCGRPLTVMSKDGKVFSVCLRCTKRSLVSRYPKLEKKEQ